ncbi:MAG: ferritin [Mediterranea massiliensis]|nr:ferritin [Mediterranea massiliensis]
MMTEKLQKAINGQITAEMWSANLYLSMSFYMERQGYVGMAHWLKKQWEEENEHACTMAQYLIKRDEPVKIDKIDVVPQTFGTPLELFQQVYEHECRVTKMIEALVNIAAAEKDMATQDFLWGFIREQVEEEATALGIVDMLKLAGTTGLLVIDDRLGKR